MKKNLRNLIRSSDLIGHLPYGSIEAIAQDMNKGRASIRGALNGDWVNIEITDRGLEKIEAHIASLQDFVQSFKPQYQIYRNSIKGK